MTTSAQRAAAVKIGILFYLVTRYVTMFSSFCYLFKQYMLPCSAGYATIFSSLCCLVQQAILACSTGYDTLFSRLCYLVQQTTSDNFTKNIKILSECKEKKDKENLTNKHLNNYSCPERIVQTTCFCILSDFTIFAQ